MSSHSEAACIARAQAGDHEAMEQLLLLYAPQVSSHIQRRFPAALRSVVSVEDILQLTLMKAFAGIGARQDTSPQSFLAWLKTIADMRLIDALRAEHRQKRGGQCRRVEHTADSITGSIVDLVERLPGGAQTASRQLSTSEAVIALQVAIAGLPEDQGQAIRLHLIQGQSLEETAVAMNRTTGAVRGLVHRGKQQLSDAMGRASVWMSTR